MDVGGVERLLLASHQLSLQFWSKVNNSRLFLLHQANVSFLYLSCFHLFRGYKWNIGVKWVKLKFKIFLCGTCFNIDHSRAYLILMKTKTQTRFVLRLLLSWYWLDVIFLIAYQHPIAYQSPPNINQIVKSFFFIFSGKPFPDSIWQNVYKLPGRRQFWYSRLQTLQ